MIDEKKLILHLNDWMLQESFLGHMKNPADTISECIKSIEEQPKIGEWIPCSERLPEVFNDVLVCTKEGGRAIAHRCPNQETGRYYDLHGSVIDNVVAWQPLPGPYKEGRRNEQ